MIRGTRPLGELPGMVQHSKTKGRTGRDFCSSDCHLTKLGHRTKGTKVEPRTIPGWCSTVELCRANEVMTSDYHRTELGSRTRGFLQHFRDDCAISVRVLQPYIAISQQE